jgi:hypothetical protein
VFAVLYTRVERGEIALTTTDARLCFQMRLAARAADFGDWMS